jgi:hypothetical protein
MEEDILKYENRDKLYKFLIEDFGFVKLEERYDPKAFGNYYIILSSNDFLLRYIKDRSFLTVEIASHSEPSNWYDLSFIKNFIYNPDNINPDKQSIYSSKRLEDLNNFLKNDFELISDLFNIANYKNTQERIDELLKRQFNQRFPGMAQ